MHTAQVHIHGFWGVADAHVAAVEQHAPIAEHLKAHGDVTVAGVVGADDCGEAFRVAIELERNDADRLGA